MVELIYCADGNKRFADIAVKYGFRYGAQLPATVYHAPYFADQNWKNPRRRQYMAALKKHRPQLATVLDWDENATYEQVMNWATEAAWYVPEIIIIPKVAGTIDRIPETIGKAKVRLGYSVPTRYGKTDVSTEEFGTRPVHLLGGSPKAQRELFSKMNVVSADSNYAQKCALQYGKAWLNHVGWINPADIGLYKRQDKDVAYFASELSFMNIAAMWKGCKAGIRYAKEDDLPEIKRIANQYKNELGFVMLPALKASILKRSLLVAVDTTGIVGFVNYNPRKDGTQTIYEIAVDRDHRGQHIGAGLIAAVPHPIKLKCTVDNPANDFYQAQGFKHAGTEDGRKRRLNLWQLSVR